MIQQNTSPNATCFLNFNQLWQAAILMERIMADYWKSNDRKFCDFCKCWITDNKPSVAFHENGRRHKANVAKRISEISRNSAKTEKEQQKFDQELRKMEDAAMRSYAKDVSSVADITARTLTTVMGLAGPSRLPGPQPQVDPLMPPGDFDPEHEDDRRKPNVKGEQPVAEGSMWVEAKSPEGYTYYWNVKTNATVWVPPKEGFMPLDEYNRINDIAVAQQRLQAHEESQTFRNKADEVVAKYRREQFKTLRRTDPEEEKKKHEERVSFKTEEEAQAPIIGAWQTVQPKKEEEEPVDLQLPPRPQEYYYEPPVSNPDPEPPVKRFKEKTIESLEPDVAAQVPATFKKRKFAKGNTRQRLDVD